MNRHNSLGFGQAVALTCVLCCVTLNSAVGQQLLVPRGATVRVLRPDFQGPSEWALGRVVFASRDSLLLAETPGDPLVRFNEALRVQVLRQRSLAGVGGALGLATGLLVGWQSGGAFARNPDNDWVTVATTAIGGLAGAGIGALVGGRMHVSRWDDVPLEHGRRSVAPLNEPNTRSEFSLGRTMRWAPFEPTVANFEAFFLAHADSLDPIEGIWLQHGTNVGIAIVRVVGTDEARFAAYTLMQSRGRPRRREDGVMVFALGRIDTQFEWYFQVPRTSNYRHRAEMVEGVLDLFYPTGMVVRWEKLGPY